MSLAGSVFFRPPASDLYHLPTYHLPPTTHRLPPPAGAVYWLTSAAHPGCVCGNEQMTNDWPVAGTQSDDWPLRLFGAPLSPLFQLRFLLSVFCLVLLVYCALQLKHLAGNWTFSQVANEGRWMVGWMSGADWCGVGGGWVACDGMWLGSKPAVSSICYVLDLCGWCCWSAAVQGSAILSVSSCCMCFAYFPWLSTPVFAFLHFLSFAADSGQVWLSLHCSTAAITADCFWSTEPLKFLLLNILCEPASLYFNFLCHILPLQLAGPSR